MVQCCECNTRNDREDVWFSAVSVTYGMTGEDVLFRAVSVTQGMTGKMCSSVM